MKKKIIIILTFIIILLGYLYHYFNGPYNDFVYDNIGKMNLVDNNSYIFINQEFVQKIVAKENNFYQVKIYFDMINNQYQISNYDTLYLQISLKDENYNIIEQYKFEKTFFEKDGSIIFEFIPIKNSKNKTYYLTITDYKDQFVIMNLAKNNNQPEYNLWIDNELTDNILPYRTIYKTNQNNLLFLIFTIVLTIIFIILIYFINKKKIKLEKQYLIIATIISLLMIVLSPLYSGHDEVSHWARIYEISNGKFTSEMIEEWPQTEIPNEKAQFSYYREIKDKIKNQKKETSLIDMQYTSVYSPISYFPQIIGTWIAKIIFSNPFFWPYIARIFEAIFSIICIFYAIKIIPFGKKIIFLITLIPTYIQATTLLSADAILVSASILFLAKILQIIYNKKEINTKDYLILLSLSIMLALSKLVYLPLCLLLIILKNKNSRKKITLILLITCFITFLWNVIALKNLMSGQGINTEYYIKHILTNPLDFLQITIYSFYHQIGNHISDLFGGNNNWVSNTIFDSTIFPLMFFILYLFIVCNGENKIEKDQKIKIAIIIFLAYTLISTSLYISCTPVYYNEIVGIQGRYFIPFLLPIYLILANKKKENLKIDLPLIIIIIYYAYYLQYFLYYI